MKSRLLRLTIALILTFSVAIAFSQYIGQAFGPPQQVFSFNPSNCFLPCVFGVTPGKTTWAEYKELITSSVPIGQQTPGSSSDFWLKDETGTKIEFYANYYGNGNPKKAITHFRVFSTYGKITTLGKLLNAQHMPVRVFRYQAFGPGGVPLILVLGDDQRIIVSIWAENRVSPDSEVDWLEILGDSEQVDDALAESDIKADEIHWLGFASVEKYLDEPIKQ